MTAENLNPWRILIIDDEERVASQVKEFLEGDDLGGTGIRPEVDILTDFGLALSTLAKRQYDTVILDVRVGTHEGDQNSEAGETTLGAIRAACFVPVVFYTALPHKVEHLLSRVVRIVAKDDPPQIIRDTLQQLAESGILTLHRAMHQHVDRVLRDHMWDFTDGILDAIGEPADVTTLAYITRQRLAVSLTSANIAELAENMAGIADYEEAPNKIHPIRFYILPPIAGALPMPGELYRGTVDGHKGYWVVVTPACDFVQKKADWVTLAYCEPLENQKECTTWRASASKENAGKLRALLKNNTAERFHYLPGVLGIPHLIVCFHRLITIAHDDLEKLDHIASLDPQFSAVLQSRFARQLGRIGAPDIDLDYVMRQLATVIADTTAAE